ncbi:MAG: hypothetical protein ABL916_16755 [Burkholderiaceae bacterium]
MPVKIYVQPHLDKLKLAIGIDYESFVICCGMLQMLCDETGIKCRPLKSVKGVQAKLTRAVAGIDVYVRVVSCYGISRFVSYEFNPAKETDAALSKFSAFTTSYFGGNSVQEPADYHAALLSGSFQYVEIAFDYPGRASEANLPHLVGARVSRRFKNTHYVGGKKSKFTLSAYDKSAEQAKSGKLTPFGETYRVEKKIRLPSGLQHAMPDSKEHLSLEQLLTLPNQLEDVRVYDLPVLKCLKVSKTLAWLAFLSDAETLGVSAALRTHGVASGGYSRKHLCGLLSQGEAAWFDKNAWPATWGISAAQALVPPALAAH